MKFLLRVILPILTATLTATAAFAAAGPAADDGPSFDVWEYRVSGVTLVDTRDIERAVYPFLGPDRRLADVEAAAQAVEAVYREAGYGATIYVNIPEQDVNEAYVLLDVSEGRVERLRVTGSRYFDLDRIKSRVPALAPGAVPHLPSMQEQLADVNGATVRRRVSPVLRPARSQGMVDVDLEVEDELPVKGGLEFSNQYVRDTTKTRLAGSLNYENLWQREHSIGFSFQLTPEDPNEVRVFSGTYFMSPDDSDWLFAMYGVKSDSNVTTFAADSAGGIGVLGKGIVIGARAIRPLPVYGGVIHNLTLGLDYKNFDDEISVPGASEDLFNPISYVKLVLEWGGFRAFDRADLKFNSSLHFSARGMDNEGRVTIGSADISEFSNKRAFARPNFVYLRTDLAGSMASLWDSTLSFDFRGQIAGVALVSNEQYALGGVNTIRGYFESQVLADNAVMLSLGWDSPSFHHLLPVSVFRDARGFVFVEGARGMLIDPLPDSDAAFGLASFGFGLSGAAYGFSTELIAAFPLIDADDVDAYDPRFHFLLGYDF